MTNGEAACAAALDVVICTYNRADSLRAALNSLAAQGAHRDGSWRVLVIDNNSSDHTAQVVADAVAAGGIPGLRLVRETEQGLVAARQRGFRETTAPWVAFVDDDCTLDADWIREAQAFLASGRPIAAFNGHNRLRFEGAEPDIGVHRPEWFAGYNDGDEVTVRPMLHGAGLVLSRASIERSGWLDHPMVPDRRGNELVSGGDNEMSLRARAGGGELWYVPQCRLDHHIGSDRMTLRYVARLSYRLGQSKPILAALSADEVWPLARHLAARVVISAGWIGRSLAGLAVRLPRRDPRYRRQVVRITYCVGEISGVVRLASQPRAARRRLIGLASPTRVAAEASRR